MRLREERAQATVEIAVVTPVFAGAGTHRIQRHDLCQRCRALRPRGARHRVGARRGAERGGRRKLCRCPRATVRTQILNAMEGYDLQIEVSSEQGAEASDGGLLSLSGTFRTYTCTMHYEPWPTSLSIAGVPLGAPTTLSHERAVTVDPWRPGVVM